MATAVLKLLVLKTNNLERLRAFYGVLGVEFSPEQHGKGPMHYAGMVGSTVLELYPLSPGESVGATTPRLGFAVADVNRVTQLMESVGMAIVSTPRQTAWGLRAVVKDPDGRTVEIYADA